MFKKILIAVIAVLAANTPKAADGEWTLPMPQWALESAVETVSAEAFGDVTLTVKGRVITIEGAEGKTMGIYDVAGNCICRIDIDSNCKSLTVNAPKGLYIVRVGSLVRKVRIG